MKATVTITLPGRPVTATLDADALPRYLLARPDVWTVENCGGSRLFFKSTYVTVDCRRDGSPEEWGAALRAVAREESRHPLDVLADLLPPTPAPGPALQWAHANADTRAPVLALLDAEAENHRDWAKEERAAGRTENALHEEGRAMGLEAAAAALRAPVTGGAR